MIQKPNEGFCSGPLNVSVFPQIFSMRMYVPRWLNTGPPAFDPIYNPWKF